jgi:hypothetical protein
MTVNQILQDGREKNQKMSSKTRNKRAESLDKYPGGILRTDESLKIKKVR